MINYILHQTTIQKTNSQISAHFYQRLPFMLDGLKNINVWGQNIIITLHIELINITCSIFWDSQVFFYNISMFYDWLNCNNPWETLLYCNISCWIWRSIINIISVSQKHVIRWYSGRSRALIIKRISPGVIF